MFIKRDRRKIEEILADESDTRECLKLSKRPAEFQGTILSLCRESRVHALSNLRVLNLYDNDLTSLQGIGMLSQSPLEEINLGGNKLTSIPLEFGSLTTLRTVWLDDNDIEQFPICLCQLRELTCLRLTGNDLSVIPLSISALSCLETLALDNNRLQEFPVGCLQMTSLKHLWLRQNKITLLPDTLDSMVALETLSVSSNSLTALPDCLAAMQSLRKLYANGNRIQTVPIDLCLLPNLKELNLSSNQLRRIPSEWVEVWGAPEKATTGKPAGSGQGDEPTIILSSNPLEEDE